MFMLDVNSVSPDELLVVSPSGLDGAFELTILLHDVGAWGSWKMVSVCLACGCGNP